MGRKTLFGRVGALDLWTYDLDSTIGLNVTFRFMCMSKARAKGTKFENEVLAGLKNIWPDVDRAKAGNPSNDFHGTPFPVEAKHRKRWEIPEWVRRIRVAAGGDNQWALVVASGDRRKSDSATLMIVDWDFGQQLLEAWDEWS